MTYFGILHIPSGKLMSWASSSNEEGQFCTDVSFELEKYGDPPWLVKTREEADFAITNSTEWFNAGYETPMNSYPSKDLKVVEINLTIAE